MGLKRRSCINSKDYPPPFRCLLHPKRADCPTVCDDYTHRGRRARPGVRRYGVQKITGKPAISGAELEKEWAKILKEAEKYRREE